MMGRRRREYEDDDGRTIVDMSQVSRPHMYRPPTIQNEVRKPRAPVSEPEQEQNRQKRPWEDHSLSRSERRMYLLGALKAGLLIGLAYIGGLGLLIWLLIQFWS